MRVNVVQNISTDDGLSHNLNGQKLGRKGRVTRERILAATVEILAEVRNVPISLSAVARKAGLGMTSLYVYFTDLTELLIAVLEPIMATAEDEYVSRIRQYWSDETLGDDCLSFIRAYDGFWQKHAYILHLRNSMADAGDRRMILHRIYAAQPVMRLLIQQMQGDPDGQTTPIYAMASVLMTGIERAVTVNTDAVLPHILPLTEDRPVDHYLLPSARLLELGIRDARGPVTSSLS
jgi:AcrR family transcriptional regulator